MVIFLMLINIYGDKKMYLEKLPGPLTGTVLDICFHPFNDSIIYVGTKEGVWKSEDRGESWELMGFGGFNKCHLLKTAELPEGGVRLYVVVNDHSLYVKDNDGEWEERAVFDKENIMDMEIDKEDVDIVYIGTWGGFYKSTDGGYNFKKILNNVITAAVEQAPDNVDRLYIIGRDLNTGPPYKSGFFISEDRGETWRYTEGPEGIYPFSPYDLMACASDTVYVCTSLHFARSVDGGETWEYLSENAGGFDRDPRDGNRFIAWYGAFYTCGLSFGGIKESMDGGYTWNKKEDFYSAAVYRVRFSPYDSMRIYVGTDMGLFVSDDMGSSFHKIEKAFHSSIVQGFDVGPDGKLWAATGQSALSTGIYMSDNNGLNWSLRHPRAETGILQNTFISIAVNPDNGDEVLGGTEYTCVNLPGAGGIFRSDDGGENWYVVFEPFLCTIDSTRPEVSHIWYYPYDANYVYSNVGYSRDGGRNWEYWRRGDSIICFKDISVCLEDRDIIYGLRRGYTDKLLRSEDGGKEWKEIAGPEDEIKYVEVSNHDGGCVMINTGEYFYVSCDSGKTWERKMEGEGDIYRDPYNDSCFYAVVRTLWHENDIIYVSNDKGRSWERVEFVGETDFGNIYYIHIDEDHIYLCGENGIYRASFIKGVEGEGILKKRLEVMIGRGGSLELKVHTIGYTHVSLYNIQGRRIDDIYSGYLNGKKKIIYNWKDLSKGIYFIRAEMEDRVITEKVVKVR